MFADFDENLSWLLDDNIANANVTIDPSFEESNMMRCECLYMSRLVTKPTKWHVHPAKTQISLGIRPV